MYRMNLIQLERLSDLRAKEGGLTYSDLAEYNVRIKDDDRYCRIKTEIGLIKEGGDSASTAKAQLYYLLSQRIDELSEEAVERIRRNSKHLPSGKWWGSERSKAKEPFTWDVFKRKDNDREFLKSCMIKGDTSWIE